MTRIAGTSAGSIAASLYAAGHDFSVLRQRALDNKEQLRRIIPRPRSRPMAILSIVSGGSVWSQGQIRTLLDSLLREKDILRFEDLKKTGKELVVIGTDLTNGQAVFFSDPGQFITNAVLDSCAIPFFFRGADPRGGSALIVDGGLCENLPVEALDPDESNRGLMVGITFRPHRSGSTPTDFLEFTKSLFDTSIENSVRRAQRRLGDDRLFQINTDIDTLEFEKALDKGFGDHYQTIKTAAVEFFQRLAQPQDRPEIHYIPEDIWETDSATTLQKHAEIYEAQHQHEKVAYEEARVLVRVDSLRASGDPASYRMHPDEVAYRLRFAPDTTPVYCHRVGVADNDDSDEVTFLQSFRREVRDRNGEMVPTIDLKARDSRTNERSYLLFFKSILQPGDPNAPYELHYTHHVAELMRPLVEEGVDEIRLTLSRASRATPRIVLFALIPEGFQVEMIPAARSAPGRIMTDAEVYRSGIHPPPSYYALGWLGEDVPYGEAFAVGLRYLRRP